MLRGQDGRTRATITKYNAGGENSTTLLTVYVKT